MSFVKGWGPDYNRKDIKGTIYNWEPLGHGDMRTWEHEDMGTGGYEDIVIAVLGRGGEDMRIFG